MAILNLKEGGTVEVTKADHPMLIQREGYVMVLRKDKPSVDVTDTHQQIITAV